MRAIERGVALLLIVLLIAPLTGLLHDSVRHSGHPQEETEIADHPDRADVRMIAPDPDSVRSIHPDSLNYGETDLRFPEASTVIGVVTESGWADLDHLDPGLSEARSDLSIVIVDGSLDLWSARQILQESVVVRAHIPPSGFLVQASTAERSGLSLLPGVVGSHPVPIGLMIEETLRESLNGADGDLIPIQVTGWRDNDGTPRALFEAPGLIGHLGHTFVTADPEGHAIDLGRFEGSATASSILRLAADPSVAWLSFPPAWELHNDRSRTHMRIADAATAFITDLNGSGQLVAVADSGLDQDHGDMNGRIEDVVSVTFNDASTEDLHSGHGTHVACTVLGDGSRGGYAGVAPEARLYFQAMEDDSSGQFSGASMDYMLRTAYNEGAYIHSNSWGSGSNHNEYTTSAEDVDSRTSRYDQFWSYDGQTVLFSAGNDGQTGVSPPATAKNSIAVANHHNRGGSAPDSIAQSSSRGPVDDGRIKPDIAAPGSWVRSCKSQDATDTGDATWTSTWYLEYSGTSMAAPNAAGASALIREYLMEVAGRPSPQGALIKSMLILGAEDMGTRDIPNSDEGWGRVHLANSLVPGTDVGVFVDDRRSLRSAQEMTYSFNVTRAWSPFKAVLSWSDYEGNTWATKQLQNDLDLTLTAPDGTVYLGNDFANGRSATGGSKDDTNNVEVVLVDSAQMGVWTLKVKDSSHGGGRSDQPFALAVRGVNVNDLRSDPIVLAESFMMSSEIPQVGDEVTITVPIANQGSGRANGLVVRADIVGQSMLGEETIHLGPGETRYLDWDWTPQSEGSKTLRISVDPTDSIDESDEENNVVEIPILVSAPGVRLDVNSTIVTLSEADASTTRWDFRLRNTALIPTNATISASKPIRLADSSEMDWFSSFGSTALALNGSEEVWIPYTVVHPTPPERGVYRITITATDVDNSIDFPLQIDLNVPVLPDVRFTRPFSTGLPISPIQNTSFEVTVHNDGNGAQGYDLSLEAPDGWHLGLDDLGATEGASGGSTGSIPQDGQRQIAITVIPPSDLTLAGVSLTGRLIVTAQTDATKSWSLDLPLAVAEHDELSVDLQTSLSTLKADARLSLMYEIENKGNRDVLITPQVTPPGGWSVVGSVSDFDLEVGETAFWRLTLKGNGQASAGDLAIRFMSGEQLAGVHTVILDVDDPISASLAFSGIVLANGSTATTPLGAGDQETGPPGFVLEWTIANDGTIAWTPTAVLRAPGGDWYANCAEMPEVAPSGFASAVCSVIIPNNVEPGTEPVLTLEIDAGGVALNDTLSLRIAERHAVIFSTPDATGLAVSEPNTIEVEVTNFGNVRIEHRVQVLVLEGWSVRLLESEVISLQPGETRSLDIEVTPSGSKSAEISVRLMGDGDTIAHDHSFTATSVGSSESASSGLATAATAGAILVVIIAAAAGVAILLRRERDGPQSAGIAPVPGIAPQSYGAFQGFEAIVEQQRVAMSSSLPPPPESHELPTATPETNPSAEHVPTAAGVTAPKASAASVPMDGISSGEVGLKNVVAPTAVGAKSPTIEKQRTPAPAASIVSDSVEGQSAPIQESAAETAVACWACSQPINAAAMRGCPGCGARYHSLTVNPCSLAAVSECRNCGANPSTFIEVAT